MGAAETHWLTDTSELPCATCLGPLASGVRLPALAHLPRVLFSVLSVLMVTVTTGHHICGAALPPVPHTVLSTV